MFVFKTNLYINLRRSRDGTLFGCYLPVRFGQLLHYAHKCIVNIMKVYIERNNMHAELIRFRKNVDFIHVYVCESSDSMFTAYSLDGTTHCLTVLKVNILHQ